jgi:hypothetical protein
VNAYRRERALCALALSVAALRPVVAAAQPAQPPVSPAPAAAGTPAGVAGDATIEGNVVDAQSGLPLSGATVRVESLALRAITSRDGGFRVAVPHGVYRLRIERDGYQPTVSDGVSVPAGGAAQVTLAVQSVPNAATGGLKTIGATSIHATESLQKSTTISRTLSPETLLETGVFRFGDALRTLPGINNSISGDTASLGDDINFDLRGIGPAETVDTLDGHPVAYGIKGGYNYQLSPTFGLKSVTVLYGSGGTDLTGYDAIGGIIDSETIDPTPDQRFTFTQGAGTFGRLDTNLTATGTFDKRYGYAASYGVSTVDGPFNDDYFYQPGAAYDPSATAPAVRDLAVYQDDSRATTRDGVLKFRYALSDATHLTLTNVDSYYWENKTGNGDGDYYAPNVALALGKNDLAGKSKNDPCPAGEFTAVNPSDGILFSGTGPNGVPDGGSPCQTPQSFANDITGLQGAGPAWQSFVFSDEALHFDSSGDRHTLRFDTFTNRYYVVSDRTFQLPFAMTPGDSGSHTNTNVTTTGGTFSDNFLGRNNEFGVGAEYTNYAYNTQKSNVLEGAPIVHETAEFVREAYHPASSPLAAYGAAYFKHDTTTNAAYVDPRLSIVYGPTHGNDVVRVTAGATTTEPTANELDQLFTPATLQTAGGGGGLSCGALNSVGSAPSSILKPERGVDEELSYGHRFFGDSQIQVAFYNTNVFNKIYSTITPLSIAGTGFIAPATLASDESTALALCPGSNPLALLGVSGNVNLGQLRARGFTVSGRQRAGRTTFFDYDYSTDSSVIVSASKEFLEQNLTDIVGAQLPRVPLHTFNLSADQLVGPSLELRYTVHAVSENNTKRLPAYNYSDLRISANRAGPGVFSVSISNLFQQDAFIYGYIGEGQTLPLNQYAKTSSYAQYFGKSATELFGLPYRSIFFNYSLQVK